MDPTTQHNSNGFLQEAAFAELDVANRQLAEAGRTIDELRLDAVALAARVDDARAEAESFKRHVGTLTEESSAAQVHHDASQADHAATLSKHAAERAAERAALESTISDLEAHVARLKKQLEAPARQLAKKVLRRGPYAKPDAS